MDSLPKFCVNCKFYKNNDGPNSVSPLPLHLCARNNVPNYNLVTGAIVSAKTKYKNAQLERIGDSAKKCGKEGKFWEAKE